MFAPKPLLLIAGLPKDTAEAAANRITDGPSGWRAEASEYGADQRIYGRPGMTKELMRLACEFALAPVKDEAPIPDPSWLVLAYVDEPGADKVLNAFGNSVLPRPLAHPGWTWKGGRHWRNNIETVDALLAAEIASLDAPGASQALRQRLIAHRPDDPLLLPARNFRLKDGGQLGDRFARWQRREIDLAAVEADIHTEPFRYERLKRFYRKCGGRNKRFAMDDRELVFARGAGQHGGGYPADPGELKSIESMRLLLEGRFRFGCPLRPHGFQNDVQWEWDRPLHNERFWCERTQRDADISGTHANVFGNDTVTEG